MGIIKRTFSSLDQSSFIQLYKSIVRPSLEYCSQVWHPHLKKDIQKLEKVQRRATKSIPELRNYSYPERLEKLKLPSLSYRRHRSDQIQTYKMFKGLEDIDPNKFFKLRINSRTRGHQFKITKNRVKTKRRQNVFSHRTVTEWNNLPEHVVNSPSINTFKANLEKAWKSKDKHNPDQTFHCPCSL